MVKISRITEGYLVPLPVRPEQDAPVDDPEVALSKRKLSVELKLRFVGKLKRVN